MTIILYVCDCEFQMCAVKSVEVLIIAQSRGRKCISSSYTQITINYDDGKRQTRNEFLYLISVIGFKLKKK
jgi:hypothetical protein